MTATLPSRLASAAARFAAADGGNFAVVTAVCAMAFMLCGGVAVDYSRMAAVRSAIDNALDAALLAAGAEASSSDANEAQLRAGFEDFFFANLTLRDIDPSRVAIESFSADRQNGVVAAQVRTNIDLAFMGLAGKPDADIRSASEASFSSTAVELAMMLDVTGSMNAKGKIAALRSAATNAVDILLPKKAADDRMRISLVPYSVSVNAGPFAPAVTDARGPFVTERWGREKFTDASPVSARLPAAVGEGPAQSLAPLSADPAPIRAKIASLTGDGGTAGHIGIAWSYYTLSPEWRAVWPATARPANYNTKDVRKIALLMTDGEFNTIYAPRGERWDSASFAIELCKAMKRDGIVVYSIAFDAPREAERTLKSCATPDSGGQTYFYSARDAGELTAAFERIALDIRNLRLSR